MPTPVRSGSFIMLCALGAGALLPGACVGSVEHGMTGAPPTSGAADDSPVVSGRGGAPAAAPAGSPAVPVVPTTSATGGKTYAPLRPAAATMQRLTQTQFANSVADVFSADIRSNVALESDELSETFGSIGAAKVGTSERGVEQYRDAAFDIAAQVFRRRAQIPLVAGCAPARATDPCIATFMKSAGLRLWRRPLSGDEIQRYQSVVGADGETPDKLLRGMEFALAGLMMSPSFTYLVQVGEKDPGTGALRFTSWEMASRLSYFVWDSTPDQELLDAAAANKLLSAEDVRAQVARMLTRPRARGIAGRFFGESWRIWKLDQDSKRSTTFPLWSAAVLGAYREEFARVLEDVVFTRRADLREIFDARETFANKDLAKVYGMTLTGADFVKVPLDGQRAGLLTSGAVVAANSPADRSSPTHRGVFVRERVLCQGVPPPPPDVDSVLPEPEKGMPRPIRQVLESHRKDPACAGCHAFFDPIGMTFENFDGIGMYRTRDNGFAVDATGDMDGRAFNGVRDLAAALKADPRTSQCIARELYDFATAHVAGEGERGAVEAVADAFAASGNDFQKLVAEVATSGGFRYLGPAD